MHPNLIKARKEKSKKGCYAWFERIDEKYIRPCFIYKYDKIKDRMELEFEDVLQEYKLIQQELDEPDRLSATFTHLTQVQ